MTIFKKISYIFLLSITLSHLNIYASDTTSNSSWVDFCRCCCCCFFPQEDQSKNTNHQYSPSSPDDKKSNQSSDSRATPDGRVDGTPVTGGIKRRARDVQQENPSRNPITAAASTSTPPSSPIGTIIILRRNPNNPIANALSNSSSTSFESDQDNQDSQLTDRPKLQLPDRPTVNSPNPNNTESQLVGTPMAPGIPNSESLRSNSDEDVIRNLAISRSEIPNNVGPLQSNNDPFNSFIFILGKEGKSNSSSQKEDLGSRFPGIPMVNSNSGTPNSGSLGSNSDEDAIRNMESTRSGTPNNVGPLRSNSGPLLSPVLTPRKPREHRMPNQRKESDLSIDGARAPIDNNLMHMPIHSENSTGTEQ
jgi:hypothetical protein